MGNYKKSIEKSLSLLEKDLSVHHKVIKAIDKGFNLVLVVLRDSETRGAIVEGINNVITTAVSEATSVGTLVMVRHKDLVMEAKEAFEDIEEKKEEKEEEEKDIDAEEFSDLCSKIINMKKKQ